MGTESWWYRWRNRWTGLEPFEKIAAIAWATSIVALLLPGYQAYLLRHHYRLSVTPELNMQWTEYNDPEFLGIVLRNDGLGPARVLNLNIFVDKKFVAAAQGSDEWGLALSALGAKESFASSIRTLFFFEGTIATGAKVRVMGVLMKDRTPELATWIQSAADRLQFSSCYCSFYDECKAFKSPNLIDDPCGRVNRKIS